jgi:hypothetical protein
VFGIYAYVFTLIDHFYIAKVDAVLHERPQEFIMIAGHIYHSGAAFGMPQYTANHIGVTLFPSPFVLLYAPHI